MHNSDRLSMGQALLHRHQLQKCATNSTGGKWAEGEGCTSCASPHTPPAAAAVCGKSAAC